MGLASISLGIVALLFVLGGMFLFCVPPLAAGLGLLAPVVSLVGIVLGGLALSRARREGEPTGTSITGLVLNILAFIPGLVVALTCGLCNACMTAGMVSGQDGGTGWQMEDGGIHWRIGPGVTGGGPDAGGSAASDPAGADSVGGAGYPPPAPGAWAGDVPADGSGASAEEPAHTGEPSGPPPLAEPQGRR